ncbi:MAG TPA: PspC family transcriptional regulator [Bacteroidia bacterium]|nr:PspC family transcriptional regulator [Bacteroidia bacterium]HNT79973.1 PspC family transcriptional regulator [Bacteroidia bacterium]
MIEFIRNYFEKQAFGICEWLGIWLQIKSSRIRLFFIYASFIAVGSPLILYLIAGFVMNLKKMIYKKQSSIFDL